MTAGGRTECKHTMVRIQSKIQTIYMYVFKCLNLLQQWLNAPSQSHTGCCAGYGIYFPSWVPTFFSQSTSEKPEWSPGQSFTVCHAKRVTFSRNQCISSGVSFKCSSLGWVFLHQGQQRGLAVLLFSMFFSSPIFWCVSFFLLEVNNVTFPFWGTLAV